MCCHAKPRHTSLTTPPRSACASLHTRSRTEVAVWVRVGAPAGTSDAKPATKAAKGYAPGERKWDRAGACRAFALLTMGAVVRASRQCTRRVAHGMKAECTHVYVYVCARTHRTGCERVCACPQALQMPSPRRRLPKATRPASAGGNMPVRAARSHCLPWVRSFELPDSARAELRMA
jgi:hypothetical protein